jgi:hypothetical protein
MAVLEGGVSGSLTGVGAEASSPLHVALYPTSYGSGGVYSMGATSGAMAAALAANAELYQFRYVTAASRIALVHRVIISAGANVAATAAATVAFRMTAARSWTAAGSGGTRLNVTGDFTQLRTSMTTSEVNDAGISTTAGLTAGTKTLDTTDLSALSIGIGTGAITVAANLNLLDPYELFSSQDSGGHPLVLANQEGFVIRSGANTWPATMTWSFSVNVIWSEVPAF